MGLGALHTYSLEEARKLARKARQQLSEGIDPVDTLSSREERQAWKHLIQHLTNLPAPQD
jgi:hypothetical protein